MCLHCDSLRRSDSFAGEDGALIGRSGSMKLVTNGSGAFDGSMGLSSPRPGSGSLVPPSPGRPGSPAILAHTLSSSWGAIDNPMRLGEIQAAAEDALLATVTDEYLHKTLSSADDFEVGL